MATSKTRPPAPPSKSASKPSRLPPRKEVRLPARSLAPSKAKKPAAPLPVAAKPVAKPVAKPAIRPAVKPKPRAPVATGKPSAHLPLAKAKLGKTPPPTVKFSEKDMQTFHRELMALRDRLAGQVGKMRQAALRRDDEVNPEEDGTDAFDRLFTLERAGSDQEIIFRINESLQAIAEKTYGICECCGGLIEKPRLQALPFAKNCVTCQSEMERNRNGGNVRRHLP
jgi:DnaK suppressor protein